ncbi:MAG: VanZ family protein [Planctomycetes bacterium]|nr:VanZ family protein [Planctomycetota bacterium]
MTGDARHDHQARTARRLVVLALPCYLWAALYPFEPELPRRQPNGARLASGGVVFEEPGFLTASGAPWVAAVRAAQRLTVELQVRPARATQYGPARILELGTDHERANLTIGQDGADLIVRLRRIGSDDSGTPPLRVAAAFARGDGAEVAIEVAIAGNTAWIAAGDARAELACEGVPFDAWDDDTTLILGDSPIGERAWLGRILGARVTLDAEPVDLLASGRLVRDDAVVRWPRRLRDLLAWRFVPPLIASELFVNVLGFVPIGFLAAGASRRRPFRSAIVVGFGLSLAMELLQLGFAQRLTTVIDLLTNSAGALIGAWTWRVREALRSRR